jgi:hypothetical protein
VSTYSKRLDLLSRYLEHIRGLRPRATVEALRGELTLANDVLFSLLRVCQTVVDTACELSARHELPFEDYVEAVRNLAIYPGLPPEMVFALEALPAIRSALLGESKPLELERYIETLDCLGSVEEFLKIVQELDA